MADEHRPTQEQSIKARKHSLFDDHDAPAAPASPSRPFKEVLRSTPAAPLSTPTRAALWTLAGVVALLLVVALLRGGRPKVAARKAAALGMVVTQPA